MDAYEFAAEKVKEAGKILLNAQQKGFEVMSKGGDARDIVTSADREVNDFLTDAIRRSFPEHSIYSEESGGELSGAYTWTIDPIDGSANFSRGIPHYAVVLGLFEHGVPTCGAIYNPVTDELYSFKKGGGAFLNGLSIRVSGITEIKDAHVLFHAGRKLEVRDWGGESYRRLLGVAKKTQNFASSSLDTCFVAAGRVEANIYGTLTTLDVSAAVGILIEAGGVVTDASGKDIEYTRAPQKIYMANNKEILLALISLLEKQV